MDKIILLKNEDSVSICQQKFLELQRQYPKYRMLHIIFAKESDVLYIQDYHAFDKDKLDALLPKR